ncbi:MAG: PH domain-containing protein [Thermomicrobiales bacterium]
MTSDPGQTPVPAALASGPRRLDPRSIVTTGLRYLRGLILPVIVVMISRGFSGNQVENAVTFGIPLAAAVISVIGGAFHWAFSRYELTDRELEVKTGFVSRQQRVVPVERIQAVDFEEAPLERLLGLVRVRVETAASGHEHARIELNALGRADAEALRTQLLTLRAHAGHTDAAAPGEATAESGDIAGLGAGEVLYRLSVRDLLLAGATSGRVGPAAAVIGVAVQFGTDLVPRSWWDRVPWDSATHAGVQAIVAVVIVLGLLAWLLAIGSTVLTFAGFELTRHGSSDDSGPGHDHSHSHNHNHQLVIRHGLLDRKRRTIPLRRIQAIVTVETLTRQPFGFAEVRIESAGQVGGDENASGVLVPFIRTREIPALLATATPEFVVPWDARALEHPPKRAAQRYIVPQVVWTVVFCLAVNLAFWWWDIVDGIQWWTLAVGVLVPLAAVLGWMEYRAAGWGLTSAHLVLRWRTLTGRNVLITRRQRLQHRGTTANLFQRRARLATFHAAVASGSAGGHYALPHLEARDADWLLAELQPARTRAALRGGAES